MRAQKTSMRILVTDTCNLRCNFCHNEFQPTPTSPHPVGRLRIDIAKVEELARRELNLHELRSLKISGGEPTLEKEATHELLRFGRRIGFPNRIVLSNFVAATESVLKELSESGLTELRLMLPSFDPTEYARVTRAARSQLQRVLARAAYARTIGIKVRANMVVSDPSGSRKRELGLSALYAEFRKHLQSLDELSFIVDARLPDTANAFEEYSDELAHLGHTQERTYRKLDVITTEGLRLCLRTCEDWESLAVSVSSDELRIVAPDLTPIRFVKGRAYLA